MQGNTWRKEIPMLEIKSFSLSIILEKKSFTVVPNRKKYIYHQPFGKKILTHLRSKMVSPLMTKLNIYVK